MPNYCKIGLAYIQSAQINSKIVETILNGDYVPPIIEPQVFLEKILLDGLTEQQRVQTISHTGFHASCIKTLTQVLHVGAVRLCKSGVKISLSAKCPACTNTLWVTRSLLCQNPSTNQTVGTPKQLDSSHYSIERR